MSPPQAARRGYALCAVGRSGSSWFMELLASTGALGRPEEAFNTPLQRRRVGPHYPAGRLAQARYAAGDGATSNGVYGLKITALHLSRLAGQIRWTAELPGLRFVHWRRRDLLGLALSRHRANATDQWYSTSSARAEATYDGDAILAEMRWAALQDARWELFFARNGIQPLRLAYEDALDDPQGAADAVAGLLGLDRRPAVDPSRVRLAVQRDALTAEWRARFLADHGDPDAMDDL